jgi:hypothetical protein
MGADDTRDVLQAVHLDPERRPDRFAAIGTGTWRMPQGVPADGQLEGTLALRARAAPSASGDGDRAA